MFYFSVYKPNVIYGNYLLIPLNILTIIIVFTLTSCFSCNLFSTESIQSKNILQQDLNDISYDSGNLPHHQFKRNVWQKSDKPKIGLALSGGGARGLAHIGVIKVIDELQLNIDYISGTSIGALIGGLYSIGYSGQQIESLFKETDITQLFDDTIHRKDYYIGEKRWKRYYNFSFYLDEHYKPTLPQGLIFGNNYINYLFDITYQYNHIKDFNNLPIPFTCTATDLLNGEMIVYRSGSIHEAIRSSTSVPSVFQPFLLHNRLTIDGGLTMNFPTTIVKDMGADIVIGVNVASDLRTSSRLTNPLTILDQALNISNNHQLNLAKLNCDILIEPDISDIYSTDFMHLSILIEAGETAARNALKNVDYYTNDSSVEPHNKNEINVSSEYLHLRMQDSVPQDPLPDTITFDNIIIEGNTYQSDAQIRNSIGLNVNEEITKYDIQNALYSAFNTRLFSSIHPVIESKNGVNSLIVRTFEKPRKIIGFNFKYNEHENVSAGLILEMINQVGNNSKFICALTLGGQRELLFDYVKNFGREWGAFFRIFPYINEHKTYFYDDTTRKAIHSTNSLEYGLNFGIGGFINNKLIVEPYLFTYNKNLYSDVSAHIFEDKYFCSGLGIKLYKDTLDHTLFAMSGSELMIKYSHSNEIYLSDHSFDRFYGRFQYLFPLLKNNESNSHKDHPNKLSNTSISSIDRLSLLFKFEYGSFFGDNYVEHDPFYVGGLDSFIGMYQNERSESIVKILTFTARANLISSLYFYWQFNIANISPIDTWEVDTDTHIGTGFIVGYDTLFAPLRIGIGMKRHFRFSGYLSLGFDYDAFEFSRR